MTVADDDRGFTLGDGLFETVLAQEGRLDLWDEHVARLVRGCAVLDLPPPREEDLRREALAALGRAGLMDARAAVRISWTAGQGGRGLDRPQKRLPAMVVKASPAPLAAGPARLVTASVRRNDTSPASRLKTLSYLDAVLARREALAAGGDEALLLNTRGQVAGAAAANVFWIIEGVLHTPALDCGVLDGVMRGWVMARSKMPVVEARVGPEVLASAQAVFLTNSLIGLRAVSTIDGGQIGGEDQVARLYEAML